jgi:hypothetical protein
MLLKLKLLKMAKKWGKELNSVMCLVLSQTTEQLLPFPNPGDVIPLRIDLSFKESNKII